MFSVFWPPPTKEVTHKGGHPQIFCQSVEQADEKYFEELHKMSINFSIDLESNACTASQAGCSACEDAVIRLRGMTGLRVDPSRWPLTYRYEVGG